MTKKPISKVANAVEASFNRKQVVDFARATLSLSGFKIMAAHEVRVQRFIDGEISLEEFLGAPDEPSK